MPDESSEWDIRRPTPLTSESLGLQHAVEFLAKNFLILFAGLALGIGGGLFLHKHTTTAYQSKGKFVVDELPYGKQSAVNIDAETDRQLVQTLILSIASGDMREAVARTMGIDESRISFTDRNLPLRLTGPKPEANIEVTATKDSRIGVITATSQSAEFAAAIVNVILDKLQLYNQIGGRLKQLRLDLTVARAKADSLLTQTLDLASKRNALAQQVAELDTYIKRGLPLDSFTAFSNDATLNNLKTQLILVKSEYDGVASAVTSGSRLSSKQSELRGLERQIAAHSRALADAIRSELEIATTRLRNLQAEFDANQQAIQILNDRTSKLVQSYGNTIEMERILRDSTERTDSSGNVVVVIDQATPNLKPIRPKLALNLALGLLLGGGAGFGIALARTLLDRRLHSPELVEQRTGQPCLAMLPPLRKSRRLRPGAVHHPYSPLGLSFLRSHLLRTAIEAQNRRIIGFSPSRMDGDACRLVADLAILLAQAERRTLVIDLHRSPPRIGPMLGAQRRGGLREWLASDIPISECVGLTAVRELAVLGFDDSVRDVDDLLARRPLALELPRLQAEWDFILLVSPAIRFDWTLMLALPTGSPLVVVADYHRDRTQDVLLTAQRAHGSHWHVEGVVMQNCPARAPGVRAL